jgi:threonine aldolase
MESELAASFDSVNVCFSKGLGAPVGSMLAGSADLIREARRVRKLFGGAMRQAGIVAAGALYALQHHRDRLAIDHQNAKQLGEAIRSHSHLRIRGDRIDTNMVIFEIDPGFGNASAFASELKRQGVDCFDVGKQAVRLVTHLDISDQQITQACSAIDRVAENCVTTE